MARSATLRGTKTSDCNSFPASGVESGRKCANRSCQGPTTPSCSVHISADMPGTGWTLCCAFLPAVHFNYGLIKSTLDPHAGLTAVPVGKHAHAVAGAEYVIQSVL